MALSHKNRREIITKAICGKGRRFSTVTHTVTPPNNPTSILGAWIINHQYEAVAAGTALRSSGRMISIFGTHTIKTRRPMWPRKRCRTWKMCRSRILIRSTGRLQWKYPPKLHRSRVASRPVCLLEVAA